MTDHFNIISFHQLTQLVLDQIDNKSQFFGIPKEVFFQSEKTDPFQLNRYGQLLETPVGVAAGPHTQLAQNIIAAWLCGARYIELKTIQTLDELEVSKPCIDMQDEGYNCEWSQELKIHESYNQYLNAWILIYLMKHKFGWENVELGTIFNMSVGYDLQGILKDNVQWFFEKMGDCSIEKEIKINEIKDLYPDIENIQIPDCISDNITLSTMHGCPPDEIEKIGMYLIEKKNLHTTIKLNPTLLGKEKLQDIIQNSGFDTTVPNIAFEHDLKYVDAISIIKNLQNIAKKNNLHFGLKLTNTLESINHKSVFPVKEDMMYMSGRPLHPISINVAKKLQEEFNGKLDISFSAGVNAFNIEKVVSCGLVPATVCSDLLKPGGYGLLKQYIDNLRSQFSESGVNSINEYILKVAKKESVSDAILKNLKNYSIEVLKDKSYQKKDFFEPDIKTDRQLGCFDCIHAPCVDTCPTNQDIPDYMFHAANGDFQKAFEVIMRTNPFPNTTGMVCDHLCQTKCTRLNYDSSLLIREIKRFASEFGDDHFIPNQKDTNGIKVAIIGAGPSGLSCAWFLTLAGFDVEVYESKNHPGGMVSSAIPEFRLTNEAFHKDIERIEKLGIKIHYNYKITKDTFEKIRADVQFIYIAVGAQKSRRFNIEGIKSDGVYDPLDFLFSIKNKKKVNIGQNVAVIGGGNTAMDAARTAFRLVGGNGKVTILYRRSIKEMPADKEEIIAAMDEGITIHELTLPIKVNSKNHQIHSLTCIRMKLVSSESTERPVPVEVPNSEFTLEFDTMIPAIGQDMEFDFIDPKYLHSEPGIYETKIQNVFIGGDALRGASTAINAISDGRKAASVIQERSKASFLANLSNNNLKSGKRELMIKRMTKKPPVLVNEIPSNNRKNFNLVTSTLTEEQVIEEASRCLKCDELCNTCVTVCPNLALYSYQVSQKYFQLSKIIRHNSEYKFIEDGIFSVDQSYQILHIADWCNECGNCTTFCPTSGAPYKEKPHLYLNREAFEKNSDCYFLNQSNGSPTLVHRKDEQIHQLKDLPEGFIYKFDKTEMKLTKDFAIEEFSIQKNILEVDLRKAAEMMVIFKGAKELLNNMERR